MVVFLTKVSCVYSLTDAMLKQCTAVQDQVLRVRVSLAMTRSEQARLVNPIVMQTLARKRRVYETASSRY
jgi:hypothetical protein